MDANKKIRDYKKLLEDLQLKAALVQSGMADPLYLEAAEAIKELLRIGSKMHTWIFLNTVDERDAYDEIGLTDEQNVLFGYCGQYILKGD